MYSPKIEKDLIQKLYNISKAKGKPMTRVVNEILRNGVEKISENVEQYENNKEREKQHG